jgi:hypothetical protein
VVTAAAAAAIAVVAAAVRAATSGNQNPLTVLTAGPSKGRRFFIVRLAQ